MLELGNTPIIKDGKLFIEPNEWLVPIKNDYKTIEQEYLGSEPRKMPINIKKKL